MSHLKTGSTQGLTRGEMAKLTGVGIETLRFYEQEGLIEQPPRLSSGYRQYSQAAVKRVRFIKQSKELGFSLKEILELLSLRVDPEKSCADVKSMAEGKIVDVEKKINALRGIKKALGKLASSCRGKGPTSECPILEALDTKE